MNKFLSIDIETTGLDKQTCQLLEFGAVIDDLDNLKKPLNELPKFHCYILRDFYVGEPYALAMHAEIFTRIAHKKEPWLYYTEGEFVSHFYHFLAQNGVDPSRIKASGKNFASFDEHFLSKIFRENSAVYFVDNTVGTHKLKFNHRVLDPAMLYWDRADDWLPSSQTCMDRAGLKDKVAHTAVEDAMMVLKLIRTAMERR